PDREQIEIDGTRLDDGALEGSHRSDFHRGAGKPDPARELGVVAEAQRIGQALAGMHRRGSRWEIAQRTLAQSLTRHFRMFCAQREIIAPLRWPSPRMRGIAPLREAAQRPRMPNGLPLR